MLQDALIGFGCFIFYYIAAICVLVACKLWLQPPREVFRKMLHIACVFSVFPLLNGFEAWYFAALSPLVFAALIYPLLHWVERFPFVTDFLIQRKAGELKFSLVIVFIMMAVLIAVFWGLMGASWKFLIVAAVMAWGPGDAAAALVGTYAGKHHVILRFVDPKKTWEGTLAMLAVSAVAIAVTLIVRSPWPWPVCLLAAALAAPVAAGVELVSGASTDTLTVPLATAAVLFGFLSLWG